MHKSKKDLSRGPRLPSALNDYLAFLRDLSSMAPEAIRHNRRWLERLEEAYGGTLLGVSAASEINELIIKVADQRKIAYNGGQERGPGGLRNRLARAVKCYFEWAFSENLIPKNIYTRNPFPEVHDAEPNWLKKKQIISLYYNTRFKMIDQAMIRFLVDTGCRVSEMLAMNEEHLDLKNGIARVYMNKIERPKVSALSPLTCATIRKILAKRRRPGPHVFEGRQGRLSSQTVRIHFQELGKEVGFRMNPHSFRHGGTTIWYHKHGPIAAKNYAGHQDMGSTAKYVHFQEQDVKAMQRTLFKGPSKTPVFV